MSITFKKYFIPALLILYFSIFFLHKIDLSAVDLGRHIKNGEVFFETGRIVSTNYYSYTEPDFKVINHHWLTGVLFFLVYTFAGFAGLSVFYALLSGLTLYLVLLISKKYLGNYLAVFLLAVLMPLLAYRTEIRPEVFSNMLIVLYLYLFIRFAENELPFKLLLPIIFGSQMLWVNLHIFFVFGILLASVFLLSSVFNKKANLVKKFFLILVALVSASLLNPYGIFGFLEPFNIFKEYAYKISENQSILFMQRLYPAFIYFYAELAFILGVTSLARIIDKKRDVTGLVLIILFVVSSLMAFRMIRLIPIFAIFCVVLVSYTLGSVSISKILVSLSVLISLVSVRNFGFGLYPGVDNGAKFFVQNNLKGPIFNNYDIGSYAIFYLFPREKVFVDNRPEAYSASFLINTYIRMQADEGAWNELSEKYKFNTIFFRWGDMTDWGQPFLIKRLDDPQWVPVFADNFVLILVKNTESNVAVISKYVISREKL